MKQTVNERVIMLKTDLKMTSAEFCHAAGIASSTFANIQNGKPISVKTLRTISEKLSVSHEWLETGNGKAFVERKSNADQSPWKDEAYQVLKDQVEFLKEIIRANGLNFLLRVRETA